MTTAAAMKSSLTVILTCAMSNIDVMSDIGSNFGFGDDVYII
jgi:hypothetical protein